MKSKKTEYRIVYRNNVYWLQFADWRRFLFFQLRVWRFVPKRRLGTKRIKRSDCTRDQQVPLLDIDLWWYVPQRLAVLAERYPDIDKWLEKLNQDFDRQQTPKYL